MRLLIDEEVLGYEDWKQPDWFRESEIDLKPLFAERNRLYAFWFATGNERDRKRHASAPWAARLAVRIAKDTWLQHKAAEAEKGRHGGKIVWRCIRDIQRARRGLVPERTALVRDENGNKCTSAEA